MNYRKALEKLKEQNLLSDKAYAECMRMAEMELEKKNNEKQEKLDAIIETLKEEKPGILKLLIKRLLC